LTAIRSGARGYLVKEAETSEIVRAVRSVAVGNAVFSLELAVRLGDLASGPRSRPATPFPNLTTREGEVLDLMAMGFSNAVIANRLRLASKTVSNHVSTLFAKLQVGTRAEAIVLARENGLGQAPEEVHLRAVSRGERAMRLVSS